MTLLQHVENVLQFLIAGLLTGVNYGLMCVGLTVIFGVMRVINFAQGEFMMLGMYFAFFCAAALAPFLAYGEFVAPFVAALLAGPAVFAVGFAVHKGLVGRVTGTSVASLEAEGHYAQLVLTLGIALILQNGALLVFGSEPRSIPTPLSSSAWLVGPLVGADVLLIVNRAQTVAAVVAVAVVTAFGLVMTRSRLGRSLRAAADNPRAAIYLGIDVDRAYRIAFAFGVGVTAIGGGLLASSFPTEPYVGLQYVIVMYAGVVLGGLGSLRGAFLGGLTIGLVQQMSALVLPTQLQNTAVFVVFLLVVLLRPQGFFGKAARTA